MKSIARPEYFRRLEEWKGSFRRKPLLLEGARQVGKTWLVRKLAETEFESILEVNFEQTPGAAALFASNDPAKILQIGRAHV